MVRNYGVLGVEEPHQFTYLPRINLKVSWESHVNIVRQFYDINIVSSITPFISIFITKAKQT
jgi:hypothetical protein